jgi:hypothetical protein
MSATIALDRRKIDKALNLWKKLTTEEQARELRRSGRVLAFRLTNVTAPFGMDQKAKKQGDGAVSKDILEITKPLNKYWMGEAIRMKALDPASFKRRFTTKDGRVWLEEQDMILNSSTIKRFHQSMRSKYSGRTSRAGEYTRDIGRTRAGNRGILLANEQKKYIKETQKKVGIAKAGWAQCAQTLGGTTAPQKSKVKSIQKWVTNLIPKYGRGSVQEGKGYIKIVNSVPWIGNALSRSNLAKSLDIQRTALAKSVIAIVKFNSKKAGFA